MGGLGTLAVLVHVHIKVRVVFWLVTIVLTCTSAFTGLRNVQVREKLGIFQIFDGCLCGTPAQVVAASRRILCNNLFWLADVFDSPIENMA